MTKRFVFIHGFKGSPTTPPWLLWASQQIEKQFEALASVPHMPYPENPVLEAWVRIILRCVREDDFSGTTFIGHSLGGAAILRALEASAEPAAHVVLVGTPINDLNRAPIKEFFEKPWDFESLKNKAARFTCIYSKDDLHVPFEHGEQFAHALGAELITFTDRGHFEADEFPELIFNLLLKK